MTVMRGGGSSKVYDKEIGRAVVPSPHDLCKRFRIFIDTISFHASRCQGPFAFSADVCRKAHYFISFAQRPILPLLGGIVGDLYGFMQLVSGYWRYFLTFPAGLPCEMARMVPDDAACKRCRKKKVVSAALANAGPMSDGLGTDLFGLRSAGRSAPVVGCIPC